jgi:peptidoglycan hydrolase-like protein with peptidoglycan-binding domain
VRTALPLAALALAGCGAAPAAKPGPASSTTASVEQRDLVDRQSVSGTLGYADQGTLSAGVAGTLTRLPGPGSVIRRGERLYSVDGKPAAWLLYGSLPAWRDFTPWMSDGEDVRQLERNLKALGYDPGTVDDDWDSNTTAAVEAFQADRHLTEDGTLTRGEIVFRAGETRIGETKAEAGDQVAPGRALATVSSTRRRVTVPVPTDRQTLVHRGDRVTVDMPSGHTVRGRITDVGSVATRASAEADATIDVTIALSGKAARGTNLDQAPVDVGFAVERRKGVLAVPVKALLARQGGGYAVELPGGRKVSVEPGLFADDWVEVAGDGLRAGMRVVTAE